MSVAQQGRLRAAGIVVTTLALAGTLSACDDSVTGTVTHIVDGDTIDVEHDGEERRVRLLNVDTPESTDPDAEPECLGPEATEYLETMLPIGTEVRLEPDEELHDRYGRFLAGVYVGDDFVNAEIARAGFGVAVKYEPNVTFFDEVAAAQQEARDAQRGLYDPAADCTLPAQLATVTAQAQTADTVPPEGASVQALETSAQTIAAAAAAALALHELLDGDATRFPLVALAASEVVEMRSAVAAVTTRLEQAGSVTSQALDAERARAAEEEARAAREAERQAAERRAQREAEREEAERVAQQAEREAAETAERAAEQAEREAAARNEQSGQQAGSGGGSGSGSSSPGSAGSGGSGSSSSGSSDGSGGSGGYDGYTGCRAYGGSVPNAVDERGRPYTKIDCTTKLPIG